MFIIFLKSESGSSTDMILSTSQGDSSSEVSLSDIEEEICSCPCSEDSEEEDSDMEGSPTVCRYRTGRFGLHQIKWVNKSRNDPTG